MILPASEQREVMPGSLPERAGVEDLGDQGIEADEGVLYPQEAPLPPREHSARAARRGAGGARGLRVQVPLDPPQMVDL